MKQLTDPIKPHPVGAFGFLDTKNMPYFTYLCTQMNVLRHSQPPRPAFRNPGNEEAGKRERVLGASIFPVSTVSKWWTIAMLKELEMQRNEILLSLSGTCRCHVKQFLNLVDVLISKSFTRQTD